MVYYSKNEYKLNGFEKSKKKSKMYDAILQNKDTKKIKKVSFGDPVYQNFGDKTGLNAYPHLIHGDDVRRKSYKARHVGYLREGYYSPSFFSYTLLW
jgi:hypothetical protein